MNNKTEQLLHLVRERRNLWESKNWSYKSFSPTEKEYDEALMEGILELEIENVKLKCNECDKDKKQVQYTKHSPYNLLCYECSEELRYRVKRQELVS